MATATLDTAQTDVQTVFPSRLIPGAQNSPTGFARPKTRSASVDPRFWGWHSQDDTLREPKTTARRRFLENFLPQPATRNHRASLAASVVTDFLAILLSFSFCHGLWSYRAHSHWFRFSGLSPLILYATIFTLLGYSERLYHPDVTYSPQQERFILAKVVAWSTVLVVGSGFLSPSENFPLIILAASSPLTFLLTLAARQQRHRLTHHGRIKRSKNVLIVGAGKLGCDLARHLESNRSYHRIVRGFLDDIQPLGGNIHGRFTDLAHVARRQFIDEVILTIPCGSEAAGEVFRQARRNRIDVTVVPDLLGLDPAAVTLEKFAGVPALTLCEEQLPNLALLVKRALDVALSFIALLLTAPLFVAIMLAIKFDSRGPALYRAIRLGRKGERFECYKFRTMVTDADCLKENLRLQNERQGPFFKINHDPRITRVGHILRRYSLDELPQLWNVLCGEMSLVGPRPHPVDDFEHYKLEDLQRLEITPGLTGLWQVTARQDPSFARNMALDREYISRWTLWLDFKILCKTVLVVLRGEGV